MTFIHRSCRIPVHDDAKTKARPSWEGRERPDEGEHRFQCETDKAVSFRLVFQLVAFVTCFGNMMG